MFDLCFLGLGSIEFIKKLGITTIGYVLQSTVHCFLANWFSGCKEYDCCSVLGICKSINGFLCNLTGISFEISEKRSKISI